jgi:arylsulfatase A-like enzyme
MLLLLALLALARPALARRAAGDARPNIILFHPDTIRAEALAAYGHPLSRTPNLDALAAQGTLFEQAHVQHTQCSPSRCAMATGRFMHVLGHRTQTHLIRAYEDNLFAQLKASGYTTLLLGKNDMLAAESFNSSFDFWDGEIGVGTGPSNYSFGEAGFFSFAGSGLAGCPGASLACNKDLAAANLTARFMLDDPPEPFAVYLPGIGAHPPYGAPEDFFARYSSAEVRAAQPLRALQPGSNKPPHLQAGGITGFRNLTSFHGGAADDELFYELQAAYLGRVAYTDFVLGALVRGVDASPMADRTAIFVHSDHGDYGGDWQAVEKWPGGMEDVLTRVPLIARVPGAAAGRRVAAPVMSVDLFPTLLELAGVARGPRASVVNGLSLVPWLGLGGAPLPASGPHAFVYSEGGYSNENEFEPNDPAQAADYANPRSLYYPRGREELVAPLHIDRVVMMRNATAKLVFRPRGSSELYDMAADPRELFNVFENASYAALRAELTDGLLRWLVLTSDVTPMDDDPRGLPPTPVPPFPWPPRVSRASEEVPPTAAAPPAAAAAAAALLRGSKRANA